MLGAGAVTGVDIDPDALDTFQQNIIDFDMENIDLVNIDVKEVDKVLRQKFEVVIMNPPFGTKHNKGTRIDPLFDESNGRFIMVAFKPLWETKTRKSRFLFLKIYSFRMRCLKEMTCGLAK